jgi:hypothetical protein
LFFTSAAFLTYRQAVDTAPQPNSTGRRVFVFQPRRIDWWAAAVQLAGTLFFNVSTGNAMRVDLTAQAANQHVWRPDAVGSICFLVASALAWFEVCHGWAAWRPRSWSWWITLANLIGSIAFGLSAVAGYISPATGQLHNAERSEPGYLNRWAVLLRRGAAAHARTHRGSQRRSNATRCQWHLNPQPPASHHRRTASPGKLLAHEPDCGERCFKADTTDHRNADGTPGVCAGRLRVPWPAAKPQVTEARREGLCLRLTDNRPQFRSHESSPSLDGFKSWIGEVKMGAWPPIGSQPRGRY